MKKIAQFSIVFLVFIGLSAAIAEDYRIHSRSIPNGFESEAAFFELLKWPAEPRGVFDATKAPRWNLTQLDKYIPADGIDFEDVNGYLTGHKSKEMIIKSLKERKGEIFQAFAHLSYIYSIPYKQYSQLSFKKSGTSSTVKMASWYKLTFRQDGASSKLIRWEYTEMEGD